MSDQLSGEAEIIAITSQAMEPVTLPTDGTLLVFRDADGKPHILDGAKYVRDHEYDSRPDRPHRAAGVVTVQDADSFVQYLIDHLDQDGRTSVWVDRAESKAIGVINGHEEVDASYGDHQVRLALIESEAWKTWVAASGKMMAQEEFADFVEENAADVADPAAATMVEIAESFKANTKVTFESTKRIASGQVALEYREVVDAKAGPKGQIPIPTTITLGLAPFLSGPVVPVLARFRYRMRLGELSLGFKLNRPADVKRDVFDRIINTIQEGVAADFGGERVPFYQGAPIDPAMHRGMY